MANNRETNGGRAGSVLNIIAGIYLLLSPFILSYSNLTNVARNDIVVGFLVLILAIIGAANRGARWIRWLTALFGIWLLFSPFLIGYGVARVLWNHIILGILIIVFSATRTSTVPRQRQQPAQEVM